MTNSVKSSLLAGLLTAVTSVAVIWPNLTGIWSCFENPYYFLFGVSAALLFGSAASLFYSQKAIAITFLDALIALLVIYITLTTAVHSPSMLKGESYSLLIGFSFLYILARNLKDYRILYLLIGLVGALEVGHGFLQHLGWAPSPGTFAISGFYNNSAPYAGLIAVLTPIFVLQSMQSHANKKYIWWGILIGSVIILILTESRAACLAALASSAWIIIKLKHLSLKLSTIAKFTLITASITTLLIGGWLIVQIRPDSVLGRLLIAKVTYTIVYDKFWQGIGFGRFGIVYGDYQSEYFANYPQDPLRQLAGMSYYAFNEPLQIATTLGIAGFILVVTICAVSLVGDKSFVSINSRSILIAVIVFGLFSYPLSNVPICVIVTIALASLSSSRSTKYVLRRKLSKPLFFFIAAFCVAVSLGFFVYQYQKYSSIQTWKLGAALIAENPPHAFSFYQTAYPALSHHGDFLFNYGAELSDANRFEESIEILNEARMLFNHIDLYMFLGNSYKGAGAYDQAEASYKHAISMIPNRFYPRYLLAILYRDTGQQAAALTVAREIIDMPVKVPSRIVNKVKSEMDKLIRDYESVHEKSISKYE